MNIFNDELEKLKKLKEQLIRLDTRLFACGLFDNGSDRIEAEIDIHLKYEELIKFAKELIQKYKGNENKIKNIKDILKGVKLKEEL